MTIPQGKYKIELEIFEGPLDLLLYLIRKNEVDIYDIPIEKITAQYLHYLELMKMLNLDIAGEYLVMAATLIYIKSKMLLPPEQRVTEEGEEVEEDPRADLVRQLLEYKRFKELAQFLHQRETEIGKSYTRGVSEDTLPKEELNLGEISIFELISAFNQALERLEVQKVKDLPEETFTVEEKIGYLMKLLKEKRRLNLTEILSRMNTRVEIVVTFLALLELVKQGKIRFTQKKLFEDIFIEGREDATQEIRIHGS